jgi:two-component system, chemotaxis family, protein-glutamate methylesterase/glutaminase
VLGTRHSAEPFDAVVAVGSLGALRAFQAMTARLSPGFPAAVVLGLHRGIESDAEPLIARRCRLPVESAEGGRAPQRGTIYVAPPDRQLLVTARRELAVLEADGRPAHLLFDPLLASAAKAFGPRLIAVVLSGRLDGGAAGVREVKRHGGRVLVQEPASAVAPAMPTAALATGCVDFALAPELLGEALVAFCAAVGAAELFRVRLNVAVAG